MDKISHYKLGSVCAVYGCNNYKRQSQVKSFFRMPKDIEVLKKWITACKRLDLDGLLKTKGPDYFYKTYVLCSDHFESHCFRNENCLSQGLFPGSVPTLNLCNEANGLKRKGREMVSLEPKETHTNVNFSLNKHPFTGESITVKRELDDFDTREAHTEVKDVKRELEDFDNRETANEVDQDSDQKSTIKSEEENFIISQYVISHEEVDIKSEDDMEQSDNWFKNHKVDHKSKDQIKIYKCPDCPYQSIHKSYVKQHSVRHKKPDEIVWHRCTECSYKTYRKSTLKMHAYVHNKTGQFETFKCAHCLYETPKKRCLKSHLLRHRRDNMPLLHCPEPECPYKTHLERNLKGHIREHSNDQLFKCTECTFQSKRQRSLKTHQLKHESTDKWHACSHCNYKTIRKCSLKKHVQLHTNPDQWEWYMCKQCPFKTIRKHNLSRHALTHAPTDAPTYALNNKDHAKWLKCTYCSFKTWRESRFKRHLMKHQDDDGPGWHKCPECPYRTPNKSKLLRHAKNHKAADQTDWLQCPKCSYRTPRNNHLKTHQMLHTGVVEWFHCFHCPYKINWKRSLVYHVKTHRRDGLAKTNEDE